MLSCLLLSVENETMEQTKFVHHTFLDWTQVIGLNELSVILTFIWCACALDGVKNQTDDWTNGQGDSRSRMSKATVKKLTLTLSLSWSLGWIASSILSPPGACSLHPSSRWAGIHLFPASPPSLPSVDLQNLRISWKNCRCRSRRTENLTLHSTPGYDE